MFMTRLSFTSSTVCKWCLSLSSMSIGKKMATSARLVNRRITSAVLANTTTYCTTVDYVMIIVGAASTN